MREIRPKLWIGNAVETRDSGKLISAGIKAVVDVAWEERPAMPPREIIYCRVPLVDGAENLADSIQLAIDNVAWLAGSGLPTMVSCSAGLSRSPTIVAAALKAIEGISFEEAIGRVGLMGPCDISPAFLASVAEVLNNAAE